MDLNDPQGFNLYEYCNADPIGRSDPLGLGAVYTGYSLCWYWVTKSGSSIATQLDTCQPVYTWNPEPFDVGRAGDGGTGGGQRGSDGDEGGPKAKPPATVDSDPQPFLPGCEATPRDWLIAGGTVVGVGLTAFALGAGVVAAGGVVATWGGFSLNAGVAAAVIGESAQVGVATAATALGTNGVGLAAATGFAAASLAGASDSFSAVAHCLTR